jgi:hypothetical protein
LRGGWWDYVQDFWDDLHADGAITDPAYGTPSAVGANDTGSLAAHVTIAPGDSQVVTFVLAWYVLLPIVLRALAGLASKVPSLFKVLIPDSIRTSAKLDVEAFDPNDPTMTAAVAARRQADPRYDAAYRAFKGGK